MNIIIPIGGLGQRFKDENYDEPKPLINVLGKPTIFHLLDTLQITENDNLVIIYNTNLDKHNFKYILTMKYKTIHFIELTKQTDGAAETILYGLNKFTSKELENKCVLLDCDAFYTIDILKIYRSQSHHSIFAFKDLQNKPIYSYITFDPTHKITDIQEKVKISDYANTGCYCFSSGHLLKTYCNKVITQDIRYKNEFYTSCVIKEMLNDGHIFEANIIDINQYICIGTPFQLKLFASSRRQTAVFEQKRFCFDLDNTLVTYPMIPNDYTSVDPITKNINMLQFLKESGHYIIIFTARRMRTHKGNLGKVIQDIGEITINTLKQFKIPYDELHFGKPHADFYIDDLAINAYSNLEKKTGFYNMKISERNFNEIQNDTMDLIIKRGEPDKIGAEIYYYNHIPAELKSFFPIFIENGVDWYSMQKIKGLALSYLYLDEALTPEKLLSFLNCIKKIHHFSIDNTDTVNIYANYSHKLKHRFETFDYSLFVNSKEIYETLFEYLETYEKTSQGIKSIIHGDPVFSNCIVTNNNDIKFIDMRGKLNDDYTIYGDKIYDYSKIYQSLMGYDEILLNKTVSNDYKQELIRVFFQYITENFGQHYIKHIKMITNSLLFSLIPLHNNDKCSHYFDLIDLIEIGEA